MDALTVSDAALAAILSDVVPTDSRDDRADQVVRRLADDGWTVALRWWEDGPLPETLAAAGGALTAARVVEPADVAARVAAGELVREPSQPPQSDDADAAPPPLSSWHHILAAHGLAGAVILPLGAATEPPAGNLSLLVPTPELLAGLPEERLRLLAAVVSEAMSEPAAAPASETVAPDESTLALRQAVIELHGAEEPDEACWRSLRLAGQLLAADWVMLAEWDPAEARFRHYVPGAAEPTIHDPLPLLAEVVGSGRLRRVESGLPLAQAFGPHLVEAGIGCGVLVPVEFQGTLLGVMVVGFCNLEQLTERVVDLASEFAFHIALALRDAGLWRSQEDALRRLQEAQAQAAEGSKFRALAQMAGGVAHEFNNALGGILGRAQMLQRQTKDRRILKGLHTIFEIGWRAAETVRRLQEFTRERSEEDFAPVRTDDLWTRLADTARQRAAAYMRSVPARYHVELEEGALDGTLLANPEELAEAVGNVVTNALEATPGGGVVMLAAATNEQNLVITVVDRGRGMSEEEKQSIFDPFYSTKAETGVGLGLSVTYGIVSRHHGEIEVDSAPGIGTTVTITLPLSSAVAPVAVPSQQTILVIDDEVALCEVLAELFGSAGYLVETCGGGREGIEKYNHSHFDLVCTDLRTEDLSGWEVIRAVKEAGRDTPVMLLTGFRDQLRQDQIAESGVDAVMGKPFTLQQVLDNVQRLLGGER